MTLSELNNTFAIDGVLSFEDHDGLTRAVIKTPACEATVYLYGAHLTHWQPAGTGPVLFMSDKSEFVFGKAIRGGIPVCFPWFGPRSEGLGSGGKGSGGGQHGFARTSNWSLAFAALADEDLHLTFTLAPSDLSESLGFKDFRVAYEMVLGKSLTLKFSVANAGAEPLVFEEALHTYFSVADVRTTSTTGLESATYVDKTDALKQKHLPEGPLTLTGWTDWVFPGNGATTVIHDGPRTIKITKNHSQTTVVWNPWAEKSAAMVDMSPDAWPHFICVETANSGADTVTVEPQQTHTMQAVVTVK
jgi:glucose-6-phosphate 1-epimerase